MVLENVCDTTCFECSERSCSVEALKFTVSVECRLDEQEAGLLLLAKVYPFLCVFK
jgi:hypothetical protein